MTYRTPTGCIGSHTYRSVLMSMRWSHSLTCPTLSTVDTNARLAVLFDGPGTIQLDMVSLLPTGAGSAPLAAVSFSKWQHALQVAKRQSCCSVLLHAVCCGPALMMQISTCVLPPLHALHALPATENVRRGEGLRNHCSRVWPRSQCIIRLLCRQRTAGRGPENSYLSCLPNSPTCLPAAENVRRGEGLRNPWPFRADLLGALKALEPA